MIKTLKRHISSERSVANKGAKTTQGTIPIQTVTKDGIFFFGKGKFSKSWRFTDVNYATASLEDQEDMFKQFCELINSLPAEALVKITINNHHINTDEFSKNLLIKEKGDKLNRFRGEYNGMLLEKAESGNGLVQERYLTISVDSRNLDDARAIFNRVDATLTAQFAKLSSTLEPLNCKERLRVFHDFFRTGEETKYRFDEKEITQTGHSFKDLIAPDMIEFKNNHFRMGEKFGRVEFIKLYPSYISDKLITSLTAISTNLMLSIDIILIPKNEAMKAVQDVSLSIEADINKWQRKQNEQNNFSAILSPEQESWRRESKEINEDIISRDQRIIFGLVTIVHLADSLQELDSNTKTIESIGEGGSCTISTLGFQQEKALNTALPYGLKPIETVRTFTTESTAVLMPFNAQEIQDSGGIFYGVNAVSRNLIFCNRKNLMNGNGFILGVSGSGKSFTAKEEITSITLATDDDILIVDPEREYSPLVKALGGEVIKVSADSQHHINALDIPKELDTGENPVAIKSEFVMSLCEQVVGSAKLGAKEKSIIDRCTANIYKGYMSGKSDKPPLLSNFRQELLKQPEREAKDIAVAIELFTDGSLNVFAHQTNVDMNNRIIVFDILDLGKQLKTIGMLVMLDAIINRVIENRKKGKRTWIYIDEIYLFFANEYSTNFLSESWKRFRKYGAQATGITQNVEDCLRSPMARTMLANSEFLLMLSQAPTDRNELARLINISKDQLSHITDKRSGEGLIKVGKNLVPFINEFPKDTELYRLMSTKPNEE